jgi:hypothetical protein
MKFLLTLIVALALIVPASVQAHPGHKHKPKAVALTAQSDLCTWWASHDSAHPDAPGSYSRYRCVNPEGNYATVYGVGRYTGKCHATKLRADRVVGPFGYVYVVDHWHPVLCGF